MVENMHDLPYLRRSVGPEVVSAMTVVCREVKKVVGGLPVGVQILSGEYVDSERCITPTKLHKGCLEEALFN